MKRTISTDRSKYEGMIRPEDGLFHQTWWWDCHCGHNQWLPLIGLQDHRIHWIWPIRIRRKWGFNYITPPPYTYSSEPLWYETSAQRPWMRLLSNYITERAALIRFKARRPFAEWTPLRSPQKRRRQFIDGTKSENEWLNHCTSSKRKQIRRGADRLPGWHRTDLADVLRCFSKFQTDYDPDIKSLGKLSQLKSTPVELKCTLQENGQGRVIAGFIMLFYGRTLYTLASSRDSGSPNFTMAHLIRQVFQLAKEQGASTIDLCGSELEGVRRFNLEMGAVERIYHQYTLYSNTMIKTLDGIYRRLT